MTQRRLTAQWSIDVDESFASRVVDQDLQLVSLGPPVRTIWVAVWSPPPPLAIEEIVETIRPDMRPDPHLRFDEPGRDEGERRLGSWYPEVSEGRNQWGLYGYTIRVSSYVQCAFLVDDESDLDWAVSAWAFTPLRMKLAGGPAAAPMCRSSAGFAASAIEDLAARDFQFGVTAAPKTRHY